MIGLVVILAVLVAATAFGLVRRRRDGRFRMTGPRARPGATPPPAAPAAGGPGVPTAMTPFHPGEQEDTALRDADTSGSETTSSQVGAPTDAEAPGRPRIATAPQAPDGGGPARLTADDLGAPLGQRATLVQFSTVFCQPCRAARQVLGAVARDVPGVVHVDVDAESHLDLVRRFHVTRTPTVLLLDPQGAVTGRATGAPRRAQVLAALAAVVPELPAS